MLNTIISAFYFVLPAYVANMCPVIFAKFGLLKFLNRPIDSSAKLGGRDLFGQNKTWRGLVAGIIGGIAVALLQAAVYFLPTFNYISLVNYNDEWLIFGALAGAGAIIGDLVKSFFKRRINIKPGDSWPVFDQLDFILGFFLFTFVIIWPGWLIFVTVCLVTLILHPLVNIIGYLIGWKKVWW
jgi:CDP-2,3-bis-(O-geranylgeranyl)-sn-glycerol synthase